MHSDSQDDERYSPTLVSEYSNDLTERLVA